MSDTRVSVLTPPGTGAIATVAVSGPRAWDSARQLFRPAGKVPLPDAPELHRFWFGTLGEGAGDEVILAVKQTEPEVCVEVHSHGGRRVVRWVVEQFAACGVAPSATPQAADLLARAPTLRTASILLDQLHGAFDRAVRGILDSLGSSGGLTSPGSPVTSPGSPVTSSGSPLAELAAFAPVGRHLVEPWKVVIAGPPNVGKSSLVNALAGYQRSVVSEVAGTTRDVVTVPVAFDGWPVELADTAGLRAAAGLEAEGIERAERFLAKADLVLWLVDATAGEPGDVSPPELRGVSSGGLPSPGSPRLLVAINKVDQPPAWDLARFPSALRVSALTGEGVPGLAAAIARTLVPRPPPPGAAVPYTPKLADAIDAAHANPAFAMPLLRATVEPT